MLACSPASLIDENKLETVSVFSQKPPGCVAQALIVMVTPPCVPSRTSYLCLRQRHLAWPLQPLGMLWEVALSGSSH